MQAIIDLVRGILNTVLSVLPHSPFADFLNSWSPPDGLGVLNWFVPFTQLRIIFTAWLGAIALFYVWSVVLRWVKLIGD